MSEWCQTTLGAACEDGGGFIRTGPFGAQLHQSDYVDDPKGIPVVMPKDMTDGRINLNSIARIDKETASRLSDHLLSAGDIVLSRRGDVGRSAWVTEEDLPVLCGTGSMRIHPGQDGPFQPQYLRYVMRSKSTVDYLEGHAVGATMPNLNAGIVAGLPLTVPPSDQQRVVGEILSANDDLIENTRRRIELLEQMAQAIYREWFVSFRHPGHKDGALVDSSLGPMPEGWEVCDLATVASTLVDGDWVETKDQGGSDYRLLQVGNIGVGKFRETGNRRFVTEETFVRLRCTEIKNGDILISRMPDPIGRAWLVDYLSEPAITAVDVAILTPPTPPVGTYLSLWLNSPETLALADGVATGTTRKRVTRSVLGRFRLRVPSDELLDSFHRTVSPMTELVTTLRREFVLLAAARDILLPKLVTGQIDVSSLDIDAPVESVA